MSKWRRSGGFRKGPGRGAGGEGPEKNRVIYFQMGMAFIFQPQCFYHSEIL